MSNDSLQTTSNAIRTVQAWQDAANAQDIDQLLALSDENIEIVGPRGTSHGHQPLREWMRRAGLTLETRRTFAHGNIVVIEQHAVWRNVETGAVSGDADIASSFQVTNGRIVRYGRFDDLASALEDAKLTKADKIL
jgi:limonene-1,2-epoxide hydrolase